MPIPPKGDPRRQLHLARRCCWFIGVLSLLCGTCAGTALVLRGRGGPANLIPAVASLLFYGGIGAAYIVFAIFLKKRRLWAVIAALAVTSIGCAMVLIGAAAFAIMYFTGTLGGSLPPGFTWGLLAFYLLVGAALGQMIYYLARSFSAIKIPGDEEGHGFDVLPLMPLPLPPIPLDEKSIADSPILPPSA